MIVTLKYFKRNIKILKNEKSNDNIKTYVFPDIDKIAGVPNKENSIC